MESRIFDLANNYGPVYGSAEDNFGRIMDSDMRPYRNQMVISTKAGYDMCRGLTGTEEQKIPDIQPG